MDNYGINDIESLTFREGVRKRIQMYLGSSDMQGVYNGIQEIISNSIDEYYMGFGNKIDISLGANNIVVVTDKGRGIPFGIKEDGSNVLVDIFSRAHTGGKFNDKVYNSVAGLNGIGAKATCLSSLKFNVSVVRDGKHATAAWEKGELVSYKEEDWHDKTAHGTSIQFIPDPEVYNLEPIKIDFDTLCAKCKNLSYLTKGLTFNLECDNKKVVYCAKNGLLDLIKDNVVDPIHSTPVYYEYEEGHNKIEIAMQWSKHKEKSFVFTNGLQNSEGGTSLTGMKTAITRFMKKQFTGEFDGDMARTGLVYAVSCKIPNPSFANQTKTKINNTELNGLAQKATTQALEAFSKKKAGEFKDVIDFLAKERKAEAAAEKARQAILSHTKEINDAQKKKVFDVDKLSDAENLGQDSILLLVEGNSAGSAMARVRDTKKYGILRLRGKIINAMSNNFEDVMANEEVKLFLKATGINIQKYNSKSLRYGKVAICVDADDDGSHIACLIMALLQELAPDFIKEGRLCWLHAPLFKVKKGKETHYFYTEKELNASNIKGEQSRFKGLGEMRNEDSAAMFDERQWLEVLEWSEDGIALLNDLMGKDVEPRKKFVFNEINFEKYGEV